MNWNEVGKNVRKTSNSLSSKIFGIINTPKSRHLEISGKEKSVGNTSQYYRTKKILLEVELKKSQAISFVRRFQNF